MTVATLLCLDKCASLDALFNMTGVIADVYEAPALSGRSIKFSCPSGMALTGPNVAICMENGEWEPDPSNIECIGDANNFLDI